MIIYTCPECGHDLMDVMLASNPPIPEKYCMRCGWRWVGKPQKDIRIPFDPTKYTDSDLAETTTVTLNNVGTADSAISYLNSDGGVSTSITMKEYPSTKTTSFVPESCRSCGNHPSNGGSGVCFCTLGQPKIT